MDEANNQINDLQHKEAKNTSQNNKKKKIQKSEDSINSLWDNFKHFDIDIIEVPEGKEKE